ncbi:osmoprotectant transport system substrate-binding protein [Streptomyces zhaozhouensis]|uniref:Osmoprotectant transport system substrate-binding protein n=1 Tax=Streptomyces zhaozhouensis TaxID=1300267 RepID=A0A286DX28_9ACTN|nr:ABC transporter substrate-binding protein [Streptomyces zhaozhouensis]SOD63114.1 osmoprotectant transport system substrate-binding protein [Streptomyces zhaozhouensis]
MTATFRAGAVRRARLPLAGLAALALALTACGGESLEESESGGSSDGGDGKGSVTVGGANFTEATLMAELYRGVLEEAGYSVSITNVDSRELYEPELESGGIDVVPEYAATLAEFLNTDENGPDAEPVASSDVADTVTALRELAEPRGLTVLDAGDAVNQNAFAVTEEFATENDLTTLTDLGELGEPVRLAAGEDCPQRPFCEPGLENTYGIDVTEIVPLGVGTVQGKQAVQRGEAELALVSTTDAVLEDFGLVTLEDDQRLQQADNLLPVVNADSLGGEQDALDALDELTATLTTEDLKELNRQVDSERRKAEDAAHDYLVERGLVG